MACLVLINTGGVVAPCGQDALPGCQTIHWGKCVHPAGDIHLRVGRGQGFVYFSLTPLAGWHQMVVAHAKD